MNEITVETEVNPERGVIYDNGGNILATNKTVYLCFISPQDIIDGAETAKETEQKLSEKKADIQYSFQHKIFNLAEKKVSKIPLEF